MADEPRPLPLHTVEAVARALADALVRAIRREDAEAERLRDGDRQDQAKSA
jgi:hypothetical protein